MPSKTDTKNGASRHDAGMPTRVLGRTGERVSMFGLGGSHIGHEDVTRKEAIRLIRSALDGGLTFMDNSWDYNEGESEIRLGLALKDGYRKNAFVMTKVDGRTKTSAKKQLDESLKRLRLDSIDLLQHHEIIRFDDCDKIFSEGGAMEAFVEAREAGKIRYIGFTGHKDPHVHLYMLEKARKAGFHFDTVQMPLNLMDVHFRSFQTHVLPVLIKEQIGVLGMKSMGSGVLLKSGVVKPLDCLHYALSLPISVVITGIDSQAILNQAFEAALTFRPLTREQMDALERQTVGAASEGKYELFKTTSHFDSTIKHPAWLGGEPSWVKALAGD